jgi:nitrogen fixation/metabolism regulation signal transduction histidine kinase
MIKAFLNSNEEAHNLGKVRNKAKVFSHDFVEENMIDSSYSLYLITTVQLAYFDCIVYGFWLTSRIAGPFDRRKTHMNEVAAGQTDSEIHFRKKDYILELAESFNDLVKNRVNGK